ncbi:MAG: sulfurtransferase TusA family protein [Proteobacteria bacterium]|nr:sulfurtransferase TusA family protein [Pseudomonadota bacterium]MBU0989495.1 sulfurtransferase TusA family protein [Pseudomonadota bacterium]MBU1903849.1 sulfurtransferase TusA family protein [Pseudomonadota bacterium]
MSIEDDKPDVSVDLSGKTCPYTVMGARDALKPLEKGQVLELFVDYEPAANESIPNFLKKKKYPHNVKEAETGKWRFMIEKTD